MNHESTALKTLSACDTETEVMYYHTYDTQNLNGSFVAEYSKTQLDLLFPSTRIAS